MWDSDGYWSKHFDQGQVESLFCCSGWVGSGQSPLGLENFPLKNTKFFNFFSSGQKNLIRLGQRWAGLLFTRSKVFISLSKMICVRNSILVKYFSQESKSMKTSCYETIFTKSLTWESWECFLVTVHEFLLWWFGWPIIRLSGFFCLDCWWQWGWCPPWFLQESTNYKHKYFPANQYKLLLLVMGLDQNFLTRFVLG